MEIWIIFNHSKNFHFECEINTAKWQLWNRSTFNWKCLRILDAALDDIPSSNPSTFMDYLDCGLFPVQNLLYLPPYVLIGTPSTSIVIEPALLFQVFDIMPPFTDLYMDFYGPIVRNIPLIVLPTLRVMRNGTVPFMALDKISFATMSFVDFIALYFWPQV